MIKDTVYGLRVGLRFREDTSLKFCHNRFNSQVQLLESSTLIQPDSQNQHGIAEAVEAIIKALGLFISL
jgi:hypothetical protein